MARKTRRIASIARIAFLLSSLLTAWPSVAAQDVPPWVQLTIVDVNPAMVEEFMAVQKEFLGQAKKAGTPWRSVSRTEVFGHTHRFLIRTPIQNLASFDRGQKPSTELTALTNRLQKCITSQQRFGVVILPEMSKPLPEDKVPDLMVINVARISPGREQDYLKLMKSDFLPHFDEAKVHYVTGSLAFGGESGFIHFFYVNNFAELDQGSPVMRELGAQGAQEVMAKFSGIVASNEQWIARHLPELSYGPPAEESEKQ